MKKIDIFDTKPELIKTVRYLRLLIKCIAILLPLAFAWLKLKGMDAAPIMNAVSANIIFKITLAFYYICWVAGSTSDLDDQEIVFVTAPNWQHVFIGGTSVIALITGMFGVLCYVDTSRDFAVFLAVFLVINIFSWLYLVKIVLLPTFTESIRTYRQNKKFAKVEQLQLVFNWYLCGKWQWARFGVGGAIVMLLNWVSFHYRAGNTFIQFDSNSINVELIISFTILFFVLVMEIWIWIMRLQVKSRLLMLDDLQNTYSFTPIKNSQKTSR